MDFRTSLRLHPCALPGRVCQGLRQVVETSIQVKKPFVTNKGFTDFVRWTVPGGWVEFQDWDVDVYSDDNSTKGTLIEQYYRTISEGFTKAGYVFSLGPHLEQ